MTMGSSMADLIILGAGAAGLFAAIAAGSRGLQVTMIDQARKPGRKIAISGGGRCNVTNVAVEAADYCCGNPHFVKSALARWTPADMRQWLLERQVVLEEEAGGKLFSLQGAPAVVRALWDAVAQAGVQGALQQPVREVLRQRDGWEVRTESGLFQGRNLLVATGGLAWPQLGATGLGHDIARQYGLSVTPRRPGLVPLLAAPELLPLCQELAGVSLPVRLRVEGHKKAISGDMLFTHHGISGPAVLDASLFWKDGAGLTIDLAPNTAPEALPALFRSAPRQEVRNVLARLLPARLAAALCARHGWTGQAGQCSKATLQAITTQLHTFSFHPAGTAGHGKAEVTLGGVDVADIDSKTMRCKELPSLLFAGEVLDVTGRLGGFNLHWAWASGRAAGLAVAEDRDR
ncbi:BaiN/RdsA family NAD(P)/FAD-dependent oxidoreductase [Megalodesulfovibrio paquesii]